MGIPLQETPRCSYVFVRLVGEALHLPDEEYDVTACSHLDVDGRLVTEALVCGCGDVQGRVRAVYGDCCVQEVKHPEWIRECILAASGRSHRSHATPGQIAVMALRCPDDELYMVAHPRALSAPTIMYQVSQCLDRWVEL